MEKIIPEATKEFWKRNALYIKKLAFEIDCNAGIIGGFLIKLHDEAVENKTIKEIAGKNYFPCTTKMLNNERKTIGKALTAKKQRHTMKRLAKKNLISRHNKLITLNFNLEEEK